MLVTIILGGGGHGTPVPMLLCYPGLFVFDKFQGDLLTLIILIGQFPIYGLLIDYGNWKSKQFITIGLILVVHIGLLLIVLNDKTFWDKWK